MARGMRALGIFLIVAGAGGWIHAFLLDNLLGGVWGKLRYERPLTELIGIAVDSEGRIYCGTPPYNRIQLYSAEGRFIDSWYYPGTVEYRLRINQNDQLEVADANRTRRGDMTDILTTYDHAGRVLSREEVDGAWVQFGEESERVFQLPSGETLFIPDRRFYPRIEKQSVSGEVSVVVRNSWILWFFAAPLPTWFWFVIGSLILKLGQRVGQRGAGHFESAGP